MGKTFYQPLGGALTRVVVVFSTTSRLSRNEFEGRESSNTERMFRASEKATKERFAAMEEKIDELKTLLQRE